MIKLKKLLDEAYKHPLYGSDTSIWTVKKPFYVYIFMGGSSPTGQWSTPGPGGSKMIHKKNSVKYQVQKIARLFTVSLWIGMMMRMTE